MTENENKFEKAASEMKAETSTTTAPVADNSKVEMPDQPVVSANPARKVIDETTVSNTSYVKFPNADQVGEATSELKITEYYQEGPCKENNFLKMKNKTTQEEFYLGLDKKSDAKDTGDTFIVEGKVADENSTLRFNSWEQVFKMSKLVRYCKDMNFTLKNQIISFKRVKFGQKNAGENWELFVPSLHIKISGKDNVISKVE